MSTDLIQGVPVCSLQDFLIILLQIMLLPKLGLALGMPHDIITISLHSEFLFQVQFLSFLKNIYLILNSQLSLCRAILTHLNYCGHRS